MSSKKRKATANLKVDSDDDDETEEEEELDDDYDASEADDPSSGSSSSRQADVNDKDDSGLERARLLANNRSMRLMLRDEDLLTAQVTRSGVMEPIAMLAAVILEDLLLQSVNSTDNGRVEWSTLRQTVQTASENDPLIEAIAPSLPETIPVEASTRRNLNKLMMECRRANNKGKEENDDDNKSSSPKPQKLASNAKPPNSQKAAPRPKKAPPPAKKMNAQKASAAAAASAKVLDKEEQVPTEIIEDEEDYD